MRLAGRSFLTWLLLGILISGCVEQHHESDAWGSTRQNVDVGASQEPHQLAYSGCRQLNGGFILRASIAPPLPPGFSLSWNRFLDPTLGDKAGTPYAHVIVQALHCDEVMANQTAAGTVTNFWAFVEVRPSADWASTKPGAAHAVLLNWTTNNSFEAALLRKWGLANVEEANVSYAVHDVAMGSRDVRAFTSKGEALEASTYRPDTMSDSFPARYFGVADGKVQFALDSVLTYDAATQDGRDGPAEWLHRDGSRSRATIAGESLMPTLNLTLAKR